MSYQGWQETLINITGDGPTLTAAAAATCLPGQGKLALPANWWYVGRMIKVTAQGRISCAVTTPGTARFDLRMTNTVFFDSGALNLNVVAKTTVPWWLEIVATCRAVGVTTSANCFGFGQFQSEAVVGAALPSAGSNGSLLCPVGTPAVGAGFDSTIAATLDMFFTQTVATGSLTVHQYKVEALN